MGLHLVAAFLILPPTGRISRLDDDARWLSEQLGKPIFVQPALAKKLLFISNPAPSPERLLSLLAVAVHCSVKTTSSGLAFVRTAQDLKSLARAEAEERAGWIRDQLAAVATYRKQRSRGGSIVTSIGSEVLDELEVAQSFYRHTGPRPPGFFATQLLPGEQLLESLIGRIGSETVAIDRAGATTEARNLMISDSQAVVGDNPPSDLKRHAIELFSGKDVGSATISMRSWNVTVARWSTKDQGPWAWWQPVKSLTAFAPRAIVKFPSGKVKILADQDTFDQKLGGFRLYQVAVEADRVFTINLPEGLRMEITNRGELRDITRVGPYTDLPEDLRVQLYEFTKCEQLQRAIDLAASISTESPSAKPTMIKP